MHSERIDVLFSAERFPPVIHIEINTNTCHTGSDCIMQEAYRRKENLGGVGIGITYLGQAGYNKTYYPYTFYPVNSFAIIRLWRGRSEKRG